MCKIVDFQKQYNLTPDGNLGLKTFTKMMEVWKLNKEQLSHFLGQVATETGDFKITLENLNYSSIGLSKTFKKYFPTVVKANQYANQPQRIANLVYANRLGNSDEKSGDGWRYRGAGGIQLTGKANYKIFSDSLGLERVLVAEEVGDKYFWQTAFFFFKKNNLWKHTTKVDVDSITKLSKAINLGNANSKAIPNGLEERLSKTFEYYNL